MSFNFSTSKKHSVKSTPNASNAFLKPYFTHMMDNDIKLDALKTKVFANIIASSSMKWGIYFDVGMLNIHLR